MHSCALRRFAMLIAGVPFLYPAAVDAQREKISAELRERAQHQSVVSVIIVLKNQPHRRILDRLKNEAGLRGESDAATLQLRQAARREIAKAIGAEQEALEDKLKALGGTSIQRYTILNLLHANIPSTALDQLASDSSIARVFLVPVFEARLANSVPAMGATAFWNAGFTGGGQTVAVLDSGLNAAHPAFAGVNVDNQIFLTNGSEDPCFSSTDSESSPLDYVGHGTAVSGVVASQGMTGWTNYLGVAYGLATLYNLKVAFLNSCQPGTALSSFADMLAALDWAVANTAISVFNYSYGGRTSADDDDPSQQIDNIIDVWGVALTVAAGNDGSPSMSEPYTVTTPGIAYNVITAANWDTGGFPNNSQELINSSSSRGPTAGGRFKPDLAAPGTYIFLPQYNLGTATGTFVPWTGTSFAAPHLASALALIRQAGVTDLLAAKAILIGAADPAAGSWQIDSGWGYANLTTGLQELPDHFSGSIGPGGIQFYSGAPNGNAGSTLVWNRHMDPVNGPEFSNLDLFLYDADSGVQLAQSDTTIQNVEQVAGSAVHAVLKIRAAQINLPSGMTVEPFGLSISQPGFSPAAAPYMTESCSSPATVAPAAAFVVSCTVSNAGDLNAFAVQGPLNFSSQTGGAVNNFGTVAPGADSTQSWNLTAPSTPGSYMLVANAASQSFGEGFSATVSFSVTVAQDCTYAASPPSASLPSGDSNGTVSVSGSAGCPWTVTSSASWLAITSGGSGTGAGVAGYAAAATNLPVPRSATLSLNGVAVATITQASGNQAFVAQQYQDLLGRNADPGGLSYWTNDLDSGNISQSQVAANFFTSQEFGGNGTFVFACYIGILGRDADFSGWNHWNTALQQGGMTQTAVLNSFLASPEYQQRFGAQDDNAFVTQLYNNTLDRAPDQAGLSYWVNQLESGAMTRPQVVNSFIAGPEFLGLNQNRIYAFMLYFGFLRRDPDSSGLSYWLGRIDSGAALASPISTFIASPEYAARF